MEEFIQSVSSQLGIDPSTAKSATGTAMGFLKSSLGDQFSTIADKIPGAEQLIAETGDAADQSGDSGGGLLGSVTGAASSLLGGDAGQGLEVMSILQKLGLSADQGGSLISMLLEFIKSKVGDGIFEQITERIPVLKSLTG